MSDEKNNSGNCNSGHCNSGNCNSGHCNSGDCNSGNRNSGHCNSGNRNSGDCNSGNRNSGFFCTQTPKPKFFDVEVDMSWEDAENLIPYIELPIGCLWVNFSDMTDDEKAKNPNAKILGGYLKIIDKDIRVAFPKVWAKMDKTTKQKFLSLPHFDAKKFFQITGVDVRKLETKTIIIEGKTIEISEESYEALKKSLL
jgi:hypothetical protein